MINCNEQCESGPYRLMTYPELKAATAEHPTQFIPASSIGLAVLKAVDGMAIDCNWLDKNTNGEQRYLRIPKHITGLHSEIPDWAITCAPHPGRTTGEDLLEISEAMEDKLQAEALAYYMIFSGGDSETHTFDNVLSYNSIVIARMTDSYSKEQILYVLQVLAMHNFSMHHGGDTDFLMRMVRKYLQWSNNYNPTFDDFDAIVAADLHLSNEAKIEHTAQKAEAVISDDEKRSAL